MKRKINLTGVSKLPRHSSIDLIQEIIDSSNGFLLNHKLFSDIQASFQVELPIYAIDLFFKKLNAAFIFDEMEALDQNEELGGNCIVFINLTFKKGTGDLRVDIPDVPG